MKSLKNDFYETNSFHCPTNIISQKKKKHKKISQTEGENIQ